MKKLTALLLLIVFAFSFTSCVYTPPPTSNTGCKVHTDANGDGKCDKCNAKVEVKDPEGPSEPDEPDEPDENAGIDNPLGIIDLAKDTNLSNTVIAANNLVNAVQGYYTTTEQTAYRLDNKNMSITHSLTDNITVTDVKNSKGETFLKNTLDTYVVFNGESYYGADSIKDARVNTTKLGYYYYSTYIRDLQFSSTIPLHLEKGYHMYSDKLHQQFRIIASGDSEYVEAFGFELKVNRNTVNSFELKVGDETLDTLADGTYTYDDLEYFALDIKDAGVIGIINAGHETKVSVTVSAKRIIVKQYIELNGVSANKDYTFANRLYTDETHTFDGIKKANYEEQNPLTDANITVEDKDGAKFLGYNNLTGAYDFAIDGQGFNVSYFQQRQKHFAEHITIKNADTRNIYIAVETIFPAEGAALVAGENTLIPVPLQVGKNFGHEKEEPIYNPSDAKYGETILPFVLEGGKEYDFTVLNIYQEWGAQGINIKQLSSIEYYISYYHLSTGVTETNCIAPYYSAYNKGSFGTSWILPDFRGPSGKFWANTETQTGDPQYNSVGSVYGPTNDPTFAKLAEYTGSDIHYAGLTYADLNYSYIDADGKYSYTMRHVEMPQTDESRTCYTIEFTFLEDTEINNKQFSIIGFDGRKGIYSSAAYLNENGEHTVISNPTVENDPKVYKLNNDGSYFTFYGLPDNLTFETGNFGLIVKDFEIIQGGSESDIGLAFLNDLRTMPHWGKMNYGSLTLSENASFKAGDTIKVDIILLPYGEIGQDDCQNVLNVYQDSVANEIKINAAVGTLGNDTWVPTVIAENNMAEFTVTGGTSNGTSEVIYALKVQGFDKLTTPKIYENVNGEWVEYKYSTERGYDGYGVLTEGDSLTYTFTFKQTEAGRTFKIVAE